MQAAEPRSITLLKQLQKSVPLAVWDRVNEALQLKRFGKFSWPDWCFIPMSACDAMLCFAARENPA